MSAAALSAAGTHGSPLWYATRATGVVALVLLTASGLLLRSFERMRSVDVGFRPDHTLAAFYVLPEKQYASQTVIDEFSDELLRDPPTHVLIVSWTFGAEIASQLRAEPRLEHIEIMTIADVLKS